MAYMDESKLADLAQAIPEATLVVGGPTGQTIAPRKIGKTLFTSATNKGKYLIRYDHRRTRDKLDGQAQVIEVQSQYSEDANQVQNLQAFYSKLADRDFPASQTELVSYRVPANSDGYRIIGSDACKSCHNQDQDHWIQSHHATSLKSLEAKKAHFEPFCQQCHTTGYGLPGGFENVAQSRSIAQVGCESCHGPSLAHVQQPTKRTPYQAVEQCRRCHDHENSPTFAYDDYWPKIAHGLKEESNVSE
jgi:hypothetical protein